MMSKHSIKREQLHSDLVAGVVKMEEVLTGMTLYSLLVDPVHRDLLKSLELNDWYSLIW